MRRLKTSALCFLLLFQILLTLPVAGQSVSAGEDTSLLANRFLIDSLFHKTTVPADTIAEMLAAHPHPTPGNATAGGSSFNIVARCNEWEVDDSRAVGNYLYVAGFFGLKTYDISDPTRPRFTNIFELPNFGLNTRAFKYLTSRGNYLYCLMQYVGLYVFDLSTQGLPHQVGFMPISGICHLISLHGNFAYILETEGVAGLRVIDLADPAAPFRRGFCIAPGPSPDYILGARNLAVWDFWTGQTLVAASYYEAGATPTAIFDVTDPDSPVVKQFCIPDANHPPFPGSLVGTEYYLYSLGLDSKLRLVDMASYNPPKVVDSLQTREDGRSLTQRSDTLFTSAGSGCDLIDISTPLAPALRDHLSDTSTWVDQRMVSPDRGQLDGSLLVGSDLDLATVYVQRLDGAGILRTESRITTVANNRVLVAGTFGLAWGAGSYPSTVARFDLANPSAWYPSFSPANWDSKIMDIAVSDNYAYASEGLTHAGLEVFDLSDPYHPFSILPTTLFPYPDEGGPNGILIKGNYLYLAGGGAGLLIYDITNRVHPVLKSRLVLKGTCGELAMIGDYVYVANMSETDICIVDTRDKSHPVWVGTCGQTGSRFVQAKDSLLVVTSYPGGHAQTDIWNASNLEHPQYLTSYGELSPGGGTSCRALHGHYMYSIWGEGVDVADVSDPRAPQSVAQFFPGGAIADFAVLDKKLYIADGYSVLIADGVDCCPPGAGDVTMSGVTDGADLATLVGYLTGGGTVLGCSGAADVNSSGAVDGTDLAYLVSYLTGGGAQLRACH